MIIDACGHSLHYMRLRHNLRRHVEARIEAARWQRWILVQRLRLANSHVERSHGWFRH